MVVEETVKGTAEGLVHGAKVLTNLADPSGILKHPNVQEAKEVITEGTLSLWLPAFTTLNGKIFPRIQRFKI